MTKAKTPLGIILKEKRLSQRDFQLLIFEKTGKYFSASAICNYVNGKHTNLLLENAQIIAKSLDMSLEELANKIK
jgi:transcriptional regulator with XRE-family HTH domain